MLDKALGLAGGGGLSGTARPQRCGRFGYAHGEDPAHVVAGKGALSLRSSMVYRNTVTDTERRKQAIGATELGHRYARGRPTASSLAAMPPHSIPPHQACFQSMGRVGPHCDLPVALPVIVKLFCP